MVGGDGRIVEAHDTAVGNTLAWVEEHAVRTRVQDKATGAMIRVGGQKMVAATFRHDTSRNLDPQLHTHCVIANLVQGGVEVYRSQAMELRAGDRVRWTRNDPGSGLVNGAVATVERIERDGVRFRLEDGSATGLADGDPQLRHLDRARAATVHAFQGRTVDRIIAAMPADNSRLTTQQAFHVAISRARDRAKLITDNAWKLADQLQKAAGERVAALDGVALQAAHDTVFGVNGANERECGHELREPEAAEQGRSA